MATYELTYPDGSREVLSADRVFEDDEQWNFVSFTAGGQERYISRQKDAVERFRVVDD